MILHDLKRYQTEESDPQCLMDPLNEHTANYKQVAKFAQKSRRSRMKYKRGKGNASAT